MEKANGSPNKKGLWKTKVPGIPMHPDDLAPEVLKAWQNYITEFERQFQDNKTIKVYQRLGNPPFVHGELLDAPSLHKELQRLIRLMEDCNLSISTLCPVEDLTLYRFITEELFDYEMEDVHIPGMKTQFCYEAFHPNHEYDLIHYTEDGILHLLSNEEEYWMLAFNDQVFYSSDGDLLTPGAFIQKVHWFKDCFSAFDIRELRDIQVEFNLETGKAQALFYIDYTACPHGSTTPMQFKGQGCFDFDYCCEDWLINRLQIPGLSI